MANGSEAEGRTGQVVAFRLGRELFAIEILFIQEVLNPRKITLVPNAPPFVQGVIGVRGQVIPIIDLSKRLGMQLPESHGSRIIVLHCNSRLLGVQVDSVHKVLDLPLGCRQPVPDALTRGDRNASCLASLVRTQTEGIIAIVDPTRLLSRHETSAWERFEHTREFNHTEPRRSTRSKGRG